GGGLPVGAGDVDRRIGPLRMVKVVDQFPDPVERGARHVLRLSRLEVSDGLLVAHQAASDGASSSTSIDTSGAATSSSARMPPASQRSSRLCSSLASRSAGACTTTRLAGTFNDTLASAFSLRTAVSTSAATW